MGRFGKARQNQVFAPVLAAVASVVPINVSQAADDASWSGQSLPGETPLVRQEASSAPKQSPPKILQCEVSSQPVETAVPDDAMPVINVLNRPAANVTAHPWTVPNITVIPLAVPNIDVGMHPVRELEITPTVVVQSHYPDCFYEGTIAALANVPKGRRLISSMITSNGKDSYTVQFPGGDKVQVSPVDAAQLGLTNRASWASLLESALLKQYNIREMTNQLSSNGTPAIQIAFQLLTGAPGVAIRPDGMSTREISSFCQKALASQTPVSISTKGPQEAQSSPILLGNHCYTLMGYDQKSDSAVLRNCLGYETERAYAASSGVQYLGNGLVKVPISLFPGYVRFLAYPSRL